MAKRELPKAVVWLQNSRTSLLEEEGGRESLSKQVAKGVQRKFAESPPCFHVSESKVLAYQSESESL
jgi:hypothetical protein